MLINHKYGAFKRLVTLERIIFFTKEYKSVKLIKIEN
jgi:hypothetical protein